MLESLGVMKNLQTKYAHQVFDEIFEWKVNEYVGLMNTHTLKWDTQSQKANKEVKMNYKQIQIQIFGEFGWNRVFEGKMREMDENANNLFEIWMLMIWSEWHKQDLM